MNQTDTKASRYHRLARTFLLFLAASVFVTNSVRAETLVFYNGTAMDYVNGTSPVEYSIGPRLLAAGIESATDVSALDGNLIHPSTTWSSYAGIYEATGFDDGNGFTFSFTVAPGYVAYLSEFDFDQISEGDGPTSWSVTINGVTVGAGSTTTASSPKSLHFSLATPVSGTVDVILTANGATSSSAAFGAGQFQINGTVTAVPEPNSLALAGFAPVMLLLAWLSGKRRGHPSSR